MRNILATGLLSICWIIPAAGSGAVFPVTGIERFETGLVKLATIDGIIDPATRRFVLVSWGDGEISRGLLANCEGAILTINCEVWGTHVYAAAGEYPIRISYVEAGTVSQLETLQTTATIEPPGNFIILSIGDSVASGEGIPMRNQVKVDDIVFDPAQWQDPGSSYPALGGPECHRSAWAGPSLTARALARTNDVTFVHVACSGAELGNAALEDRDEFINAQLDWARLNLPRIDVLLVSGGGNNLVGGLSQVILECLRLANGPCDQNPAFQQQLAADIASLTQRYAELDRLIRCENVTDDVISCGSATPEQIAPVVVISEYYDPTRNGFGQFPDAATSAACGTPTVTTAEWQFLYEQVVVPLNDAIENAAALHGWEFAGGIEAAFRDHGYCAGAVPADPGTSWMVNLADSLEQQGGLSGGVHPTRRGQWAYFFTLYDAVLRSNPPRTVAIPTNSLVPGPIEVTLFARNPIRESGVKRTFYAVDGVPCNSQTVSSGACRIYRGPFVISEPGLHTVSFFSVSEFGAPETRVQPIEVFVGGGATQPIP